MDWDELDWAALERMRAGFLAGTGAAGDYWHSDRDLASYDFTFGRRIGWKWDFVLAELRKLDWAPPLPAANFPTDFADSTDFRKENPSGLPNPRGTSPAAAVVDWGCGSGVAGRAFLRHFGRGAVGKLVLSDRSAMAMRFAAGRAAEEFGADLRIETLSTIAPFGRDEGPPCENASEMPSCSGVRLPLRSLSNSADPFAGSILLVSHVLGELNAAQLRRLLDHAARAAAVIWVEPGTHPTSRALIGVREALRGRFRIVAPCPHQAGCGLLAGGMERHWCHQFATPPAEVFTDGNWVRFGRSASIDLRSLPLSFLVLDGRAGCGPAALGWCERTTAGGGGATLPAGAMRIIGRPRIGKGWATLFGCDESGVNKRRVLKRNLPEQFRRFKRGDFETLNRWTCDSEKIVRLEPLAAENRPATAGTDGTDEIS